MWPQALACLLILGTCGVCAFAPSMADRYLKSSPVMSLDTLTDSKRSLLREIKVQGRDNGPSSSKKWQRVQYPSTASLVKRYASELEQAQLAKGAIDFGQGAWQELVGDWELLYTNNIASSPTMSIYLPPPPFSGEKEDVKVFELSSVIQRISRDSFGVMGGDTYRHMQVDHILRFSLAVPRMLLSSSSSASSYESDGLRGEIVLEHDVSVVSDNCPAKLAIDLRDVRLRVQDDRGIMSEDSADPFAVALRGILRKIAGISSSSSSSNNAFLTMLSVPLSRLLGPAYLRRGYFECSYLDADLRISRGVLGELRVFRRCEAQSPPASSPTSDAEVSEQEQQPVSVSCSEEEVEEEGSADDAPSDVECE